MSEFIIKSKAAFDIRKQSKFIARDGQSRADAFVDHLYARIEILAEHPSIGRDASRYGSNLLVWSDRKYKVYIYFTSHIAIERVISMRQSQPKSFKI